MCLLLNTQPLPISSMTYAFLLYRKVHFYQLPCAMAPSTFFDLPSEIRIQIYQNVLELPPTPCPHSPDCVKHSADAAYYYDGIHQAVRPRRSDFPELAEKPYIVSLTRDDERTTKPYHQIPFCSCRSPAPLQSLFGVSKQIYNEASE